jgi:23S rRNA (guanosine2251-2'-O)-methyltransferase
MAATRPDGVSDIVEGRNPVLEALRAGVPLEEVRIARGVETASAIDEIRRLCREGGIPVREVDRRTLDESSARGSHQGVVAIARPFAYASLAEIVAAGSRSPRSLVVVLDHITDPGNLGAVARSAEAVGASGLVIPSKRSAEVGPVARKASAGALEHLRVARVPNIPRALGDLKDAGYWVAGASERAEETAWQSRLDERLVLVMGSEGTGLSRLVAERCDFLVSLPMTGEVGSLNVAQAATVLAYEWLRRGV